MPSEGLNIKNSDKLPKYKESLSLIRQLLNIYICRNILGENKKCIYSVKNDAFSSLKQSSLFVENKGG